MTDFCQKPLTVRGNALLVDVEQAKKDEWIRRRKLRLQQVRQQSKELANVLREKVKVEKQCLNKGAIKKSCETFDQWKRKHLQSLQNELDTNLQSVGSGHNNALREIEINLLDEERKKVMSELAKARGSLALQKQKQEEFAKEKSKHSLLKRKEFARSVENLRSALVATLPQPPKQPQPQKTTVKHSPKKPKVTYPPGGKQPRGAGWRSFKGNGVAGKVTPLSPCDSSNSMDRASSNLPPYPQEGLSPPRQRPANRGRVQFKEFRKSPDVKKSSPCQPPPPPPFRRERTRHLSDCDSDVSCESDVTWPPACGHRPILVYDHDGKECRHYAPPSHPLVVPTSPNDSFTMGYEEELRQMQTGALRRQEEEVRRRRGCRAAYKQRLRSEFSCMVKDLAALDRHQRLAAVQNNALKSLGPSSKNKGSKGEDAPGRSYRFGEIPRHTVCSGSVRQREAVQVKEVEEEDSFVEKEKSEQGKEDDEDGDSSLERACQPHVQALDSLLIRLQRQRDHLLAADVYRRADECQQRLMRSDTEDESLKAHPTKQNSPCMNSSPPKVRADPIPSLRKSLPRPANQELSTSNQTPSSPTKSKFPTNSKSTSNRLSCEILEKKTAKDTCDTGVQMSPKSVSHMERPLADAACNTSLHSQIRLCTSRGVSPVNDPIQESPISSTMTGESCEESLNAQHLSPPGSPSKASKGTYRPTSSDKHPDSLAAPNTVSPKRSSNSQDPTQPASPAKPSDSSSSDYSTLNSSSSVDAVKVVVKVTGKNSKLSTVKSKTVTITSGKSKGSSKPSVKFIKESSTAGADRSTWARQLSSSDDTSRTSYRSPPPELNPSQKKLFYSILEKIDSKRKNPILHEYICKLLGMRKDSVDNLSVSTISEASVDSDVIYSHLDKCSNEDQRYPTVSKVPENSLPCRKEMTGEGVKQGSTVVKKTSRKIIIESDSIEDESYHSENVREVNAPDNAQICTDMVDKFHCKLQNLTQMLQQLRVPSLKSLSENDTSYLNLPSKIEESVRISDSMRKQAGVPLAESTRDSELCEEVDGRRVASWGLSLSLEPRPQPAGPTSPQRMQPTHPRQACLSQPSFPSQPQPLPDLPPRPRAKPPSSLYNNTRRVVAEPVVPHELSTIAEMESTCLAKSPTTQRTPLVTGPAVPGRDIEVKEARHSPECSFISSASVSPVKLSEDHQPANESSSLMILSHLDDSLTGGHCTSTEELEQVFHSLGISWAVPTLRKMNVAARRAEESSSSGEARPRRYTHSTPNKQTQPFPPDHSLAQSSNSLDAPSISLNTRYLNLIRSSTDSCSDPSPTPNSGSNS